MAYGCLTAQPTTKPFIEYCIALLKEVLIPEFTECVKYIGSSSVEVKRLYTLETTDRFGTILINYLDTVKNYSGRFEAGCFINKWVKKFEIGDSISIENTEQGLGVNIFLKKTTNSPKVLLADEGFGMSQLVALLINIEIAIMSTNEETALLYGKKEKLSTPITLFVEEPENHLHPKFQSLLADLIKESLYEYNIHFIIETHSEYLIRKLQTLIAVNAVNQDAGINNDDVSIYYMYNADKNKCPQDTPQVEKIEIREDGRLQNPFGSGFFDESMNLSDELLRLKVEAAQKQNEYE